MPAASSIYWNSEDSQRSSGSEPTSSSSGSRRRYVDPWDLENYAYLRRRQNEIRIPRNDDIHSRNLSPITNESSSDPYNWYPPIEDLYLGPPNQTHQINPYPMQQPSYEDEARYVTPNPVYVPLSDLESPEPTMEQHHGLKILPRRRKKVMRELAQHSEDCPCAFHGPMTEMAMGNETSSSSVKQLGLNTYGHFRIDYAKSWNSLHRKIKK